MEELTKQPDFLSGFEISGFKAFKVQPPPAPPISLALLIPNSVYVAYSLLKWIQFIVKIGPYS